MQLLLAERGSVLPAGCRQHVEQSLHQALTNKRVAQWLIKVLSTQKL